MEPMRNYTIGCDPEIFIRDRASGAIVSSHGLIPGNKDYPFPVEGGAIQVDGMAVEMNIDPARDRQEFIERVNRVREQLTEFLPGEVELVYGQPYAEFQREYLLTQPPEAVELGCDPDYNGWTGGPNPRPNGMVMYRTAAGHIHVGWGVDVNNPLRDMDHYRRCCEMAKQMDYYVGIYTLLWDADDRRRKLYGAAGAFRPKPYGMEYRMPSTAWLGDDNLQGWIYDASYQAVKDFFEQGDGNNSPMAQKYGDLARRIIDNNEIDWPKHHNIETGLSLPYRYAA